MSKKEDKSIKRIIITVITNYKKEQRDKDNYRTL